MIPRLSIRVTKSTACLAKVFLATSLEDYLLAVPKNTSVADLEIPPPSYNGFGRPPVRLSVQIAKWAAEQPDKAVEIDIDGLGRPSYVLY